MPQKSRKSGASSTTSRKRAPESPIQTPTRQSKRIRSSPITSANKVLTKTHNSHFFGNKSESADAESEVEREDSGYEDEDQSISEVSSPSHSEDDDEDEDEYTSAEETPRKRKPGKTGQVAGNGVKNSKPARGQELWRPGVKTGLAPGEALFIKLPKAREAGKTPYKDDTVHPNTMAFLEELKDNNDREWLKVHDADYRQSQKDFNSFVESLTEKIIEKDETIPELPSKDLVSVSFPTGMESYQRADSRETFRIYRDIRFSPDPTPYKTYYSAAWSRTGRKGPYAGYYVQIQPGGSFVGAGLWHPEAAPLALMRRAIDRKSEKLKNVLLEPSMRKEFFKSVAKDEKKVVKGFIDVNSSDMLKTKPKGYQAENPNIGLLRLRSFTIGRKLKDEEVLSPGALKQITDLIGILTPFVTYINSVIMPDGDASSDDDEDEGEGDEDDNEG
ncbi:hypothetical protein MMC07_008565 [Pseudocyphellaria aurata]|nr:hypothetical protein [Pseudocyphellaria aurata]